MRRYIFVLLATTKFFGKSFVFKNNVAGKGLPKHDPSGLGAGGPEFESRRPDHLNRLLLMPVEHAHRVDGLSDAGLQAFGRRHLRGEKQPGPEPNCAGALLHRQKGPNGPASWIH